MRNYCAHLSRDYRPAYRVWKERGNFRQYARSIERICAPGHRRISLRGRQHAGREKSAGGYVHGRVAQTLRFDAGSRRRRARQSRYVLVGLHDDGGFYDAFGEDMYTFDVDKESAKKGNRHIVFNGYHFLTVQIQTFMPNYNNLSSETSAWLRTTLAKIDKEAPGKPFSSLPFPTDEYDIRQL